VALDRRDISRVFLSPVSCVRRVSTHRSSWACRRTSAGRCQPISNEPQKRPSWPWLSGSRSRAADRR